MRRSLALTFVLALAAGSAALALAGNGSARPDAATLEWLDCGRLQCASLDVPLEYARPAGPTLTLSLARLPARRPAERIGSLVVNFGGPGGSGRSYLADFAAVLPEEIRDRFDLVLPDPRGVGRSEGLRCNVDVAGLLELDERISTLSGVEIQRRGWKLVEPCVRRNRATIAHIGTVPAARDLDRIRAALREARLTYLGFSYGTRLGSVYAHLFPRRVRALVLDGAVTPSIDWHKASRDSAAASENAFRRFFAACQTRCASRPVAALWPEAVRRLEESTLLVEGHRIGPAHLELLASVTFGGGIEERRFVGDLIERVVEAKGGARLREVGDEIVAELEGGIGGGAEVAARFAISCADDPARPTEAATAVFDRALRRAYPHAGATSLASCPAPWPVAVHPLPRVIGRGAPPIVVVGTTRDPVTPYPWAVELARALASGVLVTVDGDTHTSFTEGNSCLDALVRDYLITAEKPAVRRCA